MRIDQPDGDNDGRADSVPTADVSDTAGASRTPASHDGPVPSSADSDRQALVAQAIEHRAIVDALRAHDEEGAGLRTAEHIANARAAVMRLTAAEKLKEDAAS